MGGLKRKVPMEKIEKKDSRAVAFSKRRMGLYGKASELCLLSGAKMAILATPVSSKSNVSFYSFGGNSSVDSVVSAFLANQRPPENLGLGFWWEDESLLNSENPVELRDTLDSMSTLINDLKELHSKAVKNRVEFDDLEKKKEVSHQTLNFESTSTSHDGYLLAKVEGFVQNTDEQILEICDNHNNNTSLPGNLDGSLAIHKDLDDGNLHLSDMDEEQILGISDNNNNSLPGYFGGCNQELYVDQNFVLETTSEILSMNLEMNDASMVTTNQNPLAEDGSLAMMNRDLDQNQVFSDNNNNSYSTNLDEFDLDEIFDFETNYEGQTINMKMDDVSTSQNPSSDSETVEDGTLVMMQRDLDEDNLHFSDFFSVN